MNDDAIDPIDDAPTGLLEVDHLYVKFFTRRGVVHAVRDVSFTVGRGETVGLVGESGSGKSVTAQALMGLIDLPGRITGGDVRWKGESLVNDAEATLRRVRGKEIAMIFQDPMTSLDPLFTVGSQIVEVLRRHMGMRKRAAQERATELLDLVGIANPTERVDQHPHEMSGGMRQRVLIAMALACEPELLIADEPTTALDVTIQAQVLEVLKTVQEETQAATILITHDLGIVAEMCDRVLVMYAGRIVESGDVHTIFRSPRHPYTVGLLDSLPKLTEDEEWLRPIPGSPPSLINRPSGCAFHPRCFLSQGRQQCREEVPTLHSAEGEGHAAACHFSDELIGHQSKFSEPVEAGSGS